MPRIVSVLLWTGIAVLGAGSFALLALSRGETVNAAWLLTAALCTYAVAYRFYSKFIAAKIFALNAERPTPAVRLNDGCDYVPTNRWIVFGHHFAAIAGPGPLVGPTLAAQFGFLPGALWIIVGVALGGAVQDFVILAASTRRNGKSLGQMAKDEIGPVAGFTALVAVLGIMVVLISVLALVVVNALKASPWGTVTLGLTIPIAMLMGIYLRYLRPGRVLEASAIGIVLLMLALFAGQWVAESPALAPVFTLSGVTLAILIMIYGFAASVLPVWLLLAPRDYLSAFVKIGVVVVLAAGILIVLPPLQMPALTQFTDGSGPIFAGKVFPFAFITIACGSISGFHALVASGTTPKLLERETDARMIGYGGMLMESLVAVMALIAACVLTPGVYFAINAPAVLLGTSPETAAAAVANWGFSLAPDEMRRLASQVGESSLLSRTGGAPSLAVGMAVLFSQVLGGTAAMALWYHFAIMFEALFILTTLDAGTRVGRFMLQDLGRHVWEPFGRASWYPAIVMSSALFVAMWGHFLYQGVTDPLGGINSLWPLFGISNQLLATVALCVGTTIIIKMGKARYAWVTILPLVWLATVTLTAGWQKVFSPDPKLGFLAHAQFLVDAVAAGALPPGVKTSSEALRMIFNDRLDATVAAFFMLAVLVILTSSAREWLLVTRGRKPAMSTEVPFQPQAILTCLLVGLFIPASHAQAQATTFEFTIPSIMRGPEVVGREPARVQWTPDGRWIYFQWLEPGTDWREPLKPYRVRAIPGSKPERVTPAHMDTAGPLLATGRYSTDGRFRAVSYNGDLYLVDMRAGTARRLTETLDEETDPQFASDARRIFFIRNNNAFSLDIGSGLTRQLTDVRSGPAPKDSAKAEGQRAALETQQRSVLEAIRDRVRADSIAKAERAARDSMRVKPLHLGKDERVSELAVSPNGRALLIVTQISAEKALRTRVPNYVTLSGYTEDLTVRTKVGDDQGGGRVAFMALPKGELRWLKVIPADTTHPPASARSLGWNREGTSALVFAVSRDFKTRYIHRVDSDSGSLTTIDELRDSAWVNGPCFGCGGWYDGGGGAGIWFVSEADGFAHIYSADPEGGERRQLTHGAWEVLNAELSPDQRTFYLHTNEGSPFEQHFYTMPVSGGDRRRVTSAPGGHTVTISPDGRWLADVHSVANKPPELYLTRSQSRAKLARLTTSPTAEWMSFTWIVPEIVMIPASDGVQVPARIYRPKDMGAQPNGAGVIFVHGAGYLHNVHNYWSSYYREYMFNQFLASKGYVVLDIDYRGSAGYGRDWRTAIYRHMGGRDLQDQVDGVGYLQKEYGISPEHVGIYGGSYGGFITLMALFTEPEWFGAGAALRSVTDWAHYNHPYTARILNTPEADTLAYRRSSPIFFAEGLEDPLLIAHGMVDVNVHFQDVVRLSQRLIELGKKDWEMAVYPVEDHGFVRPSSWTDEYRRIFELFERNLRPAPMVGGQDGGRE